MAKDNDDYMTKRRAQLDSLRADAMKRREAIDEEIATYDRELEAFAAFEAVLTGKSTSSKKGAGSRGTRTTGRTASLLALLQNSPDGLRRADILEKSGVKGDKSAENVTSTALNNLKKQGKITLNDGVYKAA